MNRLLFWSQIGFMTILMRKWIRLIKILMISLMMISKILQEIPITDSIFIIIYIHLPI